MKASLTLLIASALLTSVLTGCGSQLPVGQTLRQPVLAQAARAPQSAQSHDVQAAYYNLILKAGYSPDYHNSHYGFDFGNVSFIDTQGRSIDLDLRYYSQNRTFWVVLREQGAPDAAIEHIGQDNTARLAELAKQLRGLKGGTAADKTVVARIANILEQSPRP